MKIIGITGKARAGKDTIGTWFKDHHGAYVTHFAWPIKAALEHAFSLPSGIWDTETKEAPISWLGRSPRYLAQTLGTEWGRNFLGDDVWVKALEQRLRETRLWYMQDGVVVIPDCRFENEAAWVREHGQLIHVTRNGADGKVGVQGHASEAGIVPESGDIHIENNGTVLELIQKLAVLFPTRGGR